MSNAVLDFVRAKDPALQDANDDDLTLFLADKDPGFLKDEQFAKRYKLVKQKREIERGTPVADFVDKAADVLAPVIYGMSARGAVSTLARDIGAASQVAGATVEALAKVQQAGSFKAATTPLPEVEERVVVQAARAAGELAPALAGMAAGIPAPVALGAGFGAAEFARSGDVTRAMQAAGTGIAFPAAGEIGSVGGELLAGRLAARLGLGETAANMSMTAGKVVGAQSLYTALMVAGEGEHFAQLLRDDPEKAREELTKLMLVNSVFELPRLPQLAREALARDHVDAWFKSPEYRATLDELRLRQEENVPERPEIPGEPAFRVGDVAPDQPSVAPLTEAAARDVGATVEVKELPAPEPVVEKPATAEPVSKPLGLAAMSPIEWLDYWQKTRGGETDPIAVLRQHYERIRQAVLDKAPINAKAAEQYEPDVAGSMKKVSDYLKEIGYVKEGDYYFYRGKPVANPEVVEPAVLTAEVRAEVPAVTPAQATAKAQAEVTETAKTEGKRSAKEIKSELVTRLEEAMANAPNEADVKQKFATKVTGERYESSPDAREKITIEIPDDGTFTVWNTKENLELLLKRAKRIKTTSYEAKVAKVKEPEHPVLKDPVRTRLELEQELKKTEADLEDFIALEDQVKITRTRERIAELRKRLPAEPPAAPETPLLSEKGVPMTVYRGGARSFKDNPSEIGIHFGSLDQAKVFESQAAQEVGWSNVEIKPAHLAIRKPFVYTGPDKFGQTGYAETVLHMIEAQLAGKSPENFVTGDFWGKPPTGATDKQIYDFLKDRLKERGYDAIQYKNTQEGSTIGDQRAWIVFDQSQIIKPPAASETQGAIALPGPGLAPAPSNIPSLPPKSQRQIITDLAKGLKLPIRFGRLRTTKFAGYFQRVQNLIGSKKANDIPIVTHEVGHKLDSVFGFASDPALRAELDALGDPAMPGSRSSWTPSKTQKYKLSEGVAEFVRHWLVDPPNAAKLAPNMLRQFEAALNANKDFGDTMRQAQSDIQTWRNAAPQARLRSHISIGENPNKTPYTLDQLTRDVVDDLHFLRLPVEQLKKAGVTLRPSEDPYILARNIRGSYGMADTFIQRGVADFKTKEVTLGTSLEDALKPVAGRIADFRDWIVAKRAQELHAQGRQTGLVDSDVQATAARFDKDAAFNDAFNRIKAWNDSVLQYAQDAGLVTKEGAAAMRQMNQDYVPFHRIFEIGAGEAPAVEGLGTGRGLNVGKPGSLKGLKGSPRDIIDPLETMVRNAYSIITASEKQAINLAVANLSTKPNMGQWVEHIATPKESVKVGLEKIREQLENAGADLTNVPDDLILQFFQNSKFAPFGENIIKVVRDGKPEFYRLKRELFETFHALDLEDSGTLVRMLSQPAQVLRAGVTVAPDFALANALRDAFTAAIVSRHGLLPFEAVFRGMEAMLRNPKLVAEWQAAGGKNSIEASYFDRAKLQQFLAEKITKDLTPAQQAWMVTKSPLQALRWLSSLSEEATRIGEYQKAYTDLRKRGMAEGDARRLAAFESRDRQDFAKGGAKTKIVRRLAAFWNAGLQGNVRLYQAFKEKPLQTTLRGLAFITIPKLIEQSLNWNDEDYWDRPQWQRDLFFMIPAGKGKDNHTRFILIPTPFEAGIIFGTFPGRILQTIREKNPEAAKTFPMTLARQTVPNPTPQWMLTIFEDFMIGKNGWDVYRQRQIVPKSLEQLPPEMQWTEQTSLTARKLGAALGFSPMKIDHIINSTTGGLGRQLTHQVVDRAIALATGEERTAKGVVPGGRFVSTPAAVSSQAIDDFYTTLDKIKTAAAGQKKGKADPLAAWLPRFSRTERDLAQFRKAMREATAEEDKNVYAEAILRTSRILMKQFKEAQNAADR